MHFEVLDPATGRYELLAYIADFFRTVPGNVLGGNHESEMEDCFWIGRHFFFRCGKKCSCITMPEP